MSKFVDRQTDYIKDREEALSLQTYEYQYPGDLNLKPGSDEHGKLLSRLLELIQTGRTPIQDKRDKWETIDQSMNAFVTLDDEETEDRLKDNRLPSRIVIPTSFAIEDTILSYLLFPKIIN